jgi:hypothetical protein
LFQELHQREYPPLVIWFNHIGGPISISGCCYNPLNAASDLVVTYLVSISSTFMRAFLVRTSFRQLFS